jgi:hypothetical protein
MPDHLTETAHHLDFGTLRAPVTGSGSHRNGGAAEPSSPVIPYADRVDVLVTQRTPGAFGGRPGVTSRPFTPYTCDKP